MSEKENNPDQDKEFIKSLIDFCKIVAPFDYDQLRVLERLLQERPDIRDRVSGAVKSQKPELYIDGGLKDLIREELIKEKKKPYK